MDTTIHERLAKVETQLQGLTEDFKATAGDVRAIRDHVLTAKTRNAQTLKLVGWAGGLVTGIAGIYGALHLRLFG